MLSTAAEQYRYFLDEVRKEKTVVITPAQWTRMINPFILDWVKTKLPELEFNQKRIDDLETIKVVTDGKQYARLQSTQDSGGIFAIPYALTTHPSYLHGISAEFGFYIEITGEDLTPPPYTNPNPVPSVTAPTLVRSVAGKILRGDMRTKWKTNSYRKPDDVNYIYFENRGNYIYTIAESHTYNRLELEYYRYPDLVEYDPDTSTDNPGSFMPVQNKEILDMAVTRYLEKVMDQRIKTQPMVAAQVPK